MSSNTTETTDTGDDPIDAGNGSDQLGPNECCEGSFRHIFQGPAYGVVPVILMVASCAPVLWILLKILCGKQRFHEYTSTSGRRQPSRSPTRKRRPSATRTSASTQSGGKNGGRRGALKNKPRDLEEGGGNVKANKGKPKTKNGKTESGRKPPKGQQQQRKNDNNTKNKNKKSNGQTVLHHPPKKTKVKKKPGELKNKEASKRNSQPSSNRSSTKPASDLSIQPALNGTSKPTTSNRRSVSRISYASDIDPKIRRQLVVSGLSKIILRVYVGFYVSAAAGSAEQCRNDCLKDGYGHEALVMGYVVLIAAGLLDSISFFHFRPLPLGRSLSEVRWKRLQQLELRKDTTSTSHCALKFKRPSTTIGLVFLAAALVSLIGHLQAAKDVQEVLSVLIGITFVLLAAVVIITLVPSVLCDGYGFMGVIPIIINTPMPAPGTRVSLKTLKSCAGYWDAIRSILFVLPGLLICLVGGNWAAVGGWLLECIDLMGDFFLNRPYMLTRGE